MIDEDGKWVMGGVRTSDSCYGIGPSTSLSCKHAKLDVPELWHQCFGHLNFNDLYKVSKDDLICGLPKLGKHERMVCGPCQLGEQIKSQHRATKSIHTSFNFELLHMDLMTPTRIESIGGKKYIMVFVDDYSRFTWMILLKDKLEACDQAKILFKMI